MEVNAYRQGGLMILNGLLNTLNDKDVVGELADYTLRAVKDTIEQPFDTNVKKTAIGLI